MDPKPVLCIERKGSGRIGKQISPTTIRSQRVWLFLSGQVKDRTLVGVPGWGSSSMSWPCVLLPPASW